MSTIITAALAADVNHAERTITGVVVYYGRPADASNGRVQFEAGSLILPDDLSRIKLCLDHDHHSAIGYATAAETADDHLTMTFHIPETTAGDEALASARAGIRDGLSVGAYPTRDGAQYINGEDCYHVTEAHLREVSLVAVPAFDDARVTNVTATAQTQEGTPMPHETPDQTDPQPVAAQIQAPAILTPAHAGPKTALEAARLVVALTAEGAGTAKINAALNDITTTDDKGQGFTRPAWLAQLWQAVRTDRPLIDSFTRKDLTSIEAKGWRWKTRPTVGEYAGDKAEIPTSKAETEPVSEKAKRIAAGWDVDRIYADLGDPSMIEALWEGAAEDYALKSEVAFTKHVLAKATAVEDASGGTPKLIDNLIKLGAKATGQGSRIDFLAFGTDVWTAFTALTKDQVPWWITHGDGINISTGSAAVNGIRLFNDPGLGPGQILGGDKRAVTYYEVDPPIRVNAVDLAHGGLDLGLFGYWSAIVHDERALFKVGA